MSDEQPAPLSVRKTSSVEKYVLRFEKGCLWAFFVIDASDHSLMIMSDYGDWAYRWPANQGRNFEFKEFLIGLARTGDSYLISKLAGGERDFDWKSTMQDLKRDILRERRARDISEDKARGLFEELEGIDDSRPTSDAAFLVMARDTVYLERYLNSYDDGPCRYTPPYHLSRFVREVYPHFTNALKKEIENERGGKPSSHDADSAAASL